MRLLRFDSSRGLTSTDFSRKKTPPYAILSHTWGDNEFLFEDMANNTGSSKAGYQKIMFCGEQVARDDIQYFWIDTCCIDKWNLRELSNAINSMFQWYKNAEKCYVFLSDVSTHMTDVQLHQSTWEASFRECKWFTRGWTLQELLAPASIDFYSSEGQRLGDKDTLEQQIHEITRIPITALRGNALEEFSDSERMEWMVGRQTTQEEDMAYSLIGIFRVSMEFRYGEGKERSLKRLQEEKQKANTTPFIVPFNRNDRFVGRESQLTKLEGKLFVGASTTKVVIEGLVGIGKTQLALELAYRIRQRFKNCSVFWISVNDTESLYQAFAQIAQQLKIPGWDDEKADIKKLVQLHLSKESAGQWLLIFDNAEEAESESAGSSKAASLSECLPSSAQGAVVFTTADRTTAAKLASHNIVELPKMEQDMAQKMLETHLVYSMNEQEQADLLLKELAYLPLAIVQAAAYVNVNKISLQEYQSLLAEKKKEAVEPIDKKSASLIATTWLISFEQICRHDTLAADYLLFMACIDRNDVPLSLLLADSLREKGARAVGTLEAYSFVTKRTAQSALNLHRLKGLLSQQTQVVIRCLLKIFPVPNYGSRSKWRRLLPHAKFALSSVIPEQENIARTSLLWKCAMTLHIDGRFNEAEVQVLERRKTVLGEEHPDTLNGMANLASTYGNQGRWKEDEDLEVQVMERRKRVLGEEHPDTLTSMANLALVYKNQGRWKEAHDVFGEEHRSTLVSMANLASSYREQRRWKEAEELEVQVIKTSLRVLGEEHPDTLNGMANLASTYGNQGRLKDAEELEVQVMERRKRVMGEEHPETLTSMANLASTYECQGRWKEAEDLEVQVMERKKRAMGEEHPNTLTSMASLASAYRYQGRWKEAEELEMQVLERRKMVMGEEHPYTLTSMTNLASTYRDQGRTRVLGEEHPSTLAIMANLASSYREQGRWKEAEEIFVQVIKTSLRVFGEEHPSTLAIMANLASLYREQGRWKEAEEILVQVIKTSLRVLGKGHPSTMICMKKAEDLFVQVIKTSLRVLGEEHPSTLTSMAKLASTYRDQGRWKQAEDLGVQVLERRKTVLGEEHPDTLTSMANLASTYRDQGRWKEAEDLEVQVLERRKTVLGEEHPSTLASMVNLASTYREQGRWKEAEDLELHVLERRKTVMGEEHPSMLASMANLACKSSKGERG
ncbi:kinesin light chain 3 [Clathrospora elynae]|uniref:Kinesin light chain 3 n=1 Tax=Clathrospora elynae TaxID=706981 RepID=A0A6A5SBN5_9PLEO|nr:kinesin light chain 3 [Clathrospora elynae]